MCVVKNHRPERAHAGKIAVQSSQYSQTLEAVTGSAATLNLWTFPVGYVSTPTPTGGVREGGCHRRHPSFDVWECSLGHVHQKCLEDDAGVSQVVYRIDDLVCWDRETSRVGSQHDCSMNAVVCQKNTPNSAACCVVDRHDHYKGVIVISRGFRAGRRGIASYKMKHTGESVVENGTWHIAWKRKERRPHLPFHGLTLSTVLTARSITDVRLTRR